MAHIPAIQFGLTDYDQVHITNDGHFSERGYMAVNSETINGHAVPKPPGTLFLSYHGDGTVGPSGINYSHLTYNVYWSPQAGHFSVGSSGATLTGLTNIGEIGHGELNPTLGGHLTPHADGSISGDINTIMHSGSVTTPFVIGGGQIASHVTPIRGGFNIVGDGLHGSFAGAAPSHLFMG